MFKRLLRDGDEAAKEIGLSRAERRLAIRDVRRPCFAAIAIVARHQSRRAPIGATALALFRAHLTVAVENGGEAYDPLANDSPRGNQWSPDMTDSGVRRFRFAPLFAQADEFARFVADDKAKAALRLGV